MTKLNYASLYSLGTNVGEDFVVYDVANRKVYFFHHADSGIRLKFIKGKRVKPVTIRHTDRVFRLEQDGSVTRGDMTGLVRE